MQHAIQCAADLVGEHRVTAAGRRRARARAGFPHVPAVQALDPAEPPDQVRARAPRTVVEQSRPLTGQVLARRADQDLLLAEHAAPPRALPPRRVRLADPASITRHRS
jgi:hypothetical protein